MTFGFNPNASFIAVRVDVLGPVSSGQTVFSLDTGSTQTVVDETWLRQLGYDSSRAIRAISVRTAGGPATMTEYRLSKLSAFGLDANDFVVSAINLPSPRYGGLLGKDFFRGRILKIDFGNGTIEVR